MSGGYKVRLRNFSHRRTSKYMSICLLCSKRQLIKFFEPGDMIVIELFNTNLIGISIDVLRSINEYRFEIGRC